MTTLARIEPRSFLRSLGPFLYRPIVLLFKNCFCVISFTFEYVRFGYIAESIIIIITSLEAETPIVGAVIIPSEESPHSVILFLAPAPAGGEWRALETATHRCAYPNDLRRANRSENAQKHIHRVVYVLVGG